MLLGRKPIGTVAYMGGVPTLPEPFVWSLANMIAWNAEYLVRENEYVHYDRATMSYHVAARNFLVDSFRGDWLLMLDTDLTFNPDLTGRLLKVIEQGQVDVVCGIYHFKHGSCSPVLYGLSNDRFLPITKWDIPAEDYLLPIASAGAGCLMVKRNVFQRIKDELNVGPFDVEPPYSEDHSFFRRLKKLGIKAMCDPNVKCGHLKWYPVSMADMRIEEDAITERIELQPVRN